MMENVRELMQEETQQFLDTLVEQADYPIWKTQIASGELCESIKSWCQHYQVDLVICGNHNQSFFSRATCSAKNIVGSSCADVLLVTFNTPYATPVLSAPASFFPYASFGNAATLLSI